MRKKSAAVKEFLKPVGDGFTRNNPTFRLVLGTCPTLAVTTGAFNGFAMGLLTTFVLVFSNILVSVLSRFIPRKVRIPCFILIITSLSTVTEMLVEFISSELYASLGIYLSLIAVNCIILGRAESFASVHSPLASLADGLGVGLGFTASITAIGLIRELLGAGTFFAGSFLGHEFGWEISALTEAGLPMTFFVLPAGGFFVFALTMVVFNAAFNKYNERLETIEAHLLADESTMVPAVGHKEDIE